jgi:hypothetical protein
MSYLDTASQLRAELADRRVELERELARVTELEASLNGLSESRMAVVDVPKPPTRTVPERKHPRKKKVNGEATKIVLNALATHGPLSLDQLKQKTGRSGTGIAAVLRVQSEAGKVAQVTSDGNVRYDITDRAPLTA